MCTHNQCFERKKKEKHHNVSSENYLFSAVKNCIILHGRVFVMLRAVPVPGQYLSFTYISLI